VGSKAFARTTLEFIADGVQQDRGGGDGACRKNDIRLATTQGNWASGSVKDGRGIALWVDLKAFDNDVSGNHERFTIRYLFTRTRWTNTTLYKSFASHGFEEAL